MLRPVWFVQVVVEAAFRNLGTEKKLTTKYRSSSVGHCKKHAQATTNKGRISSRKQSMYVPPYVEV